MHIFITIDTYIVLYAHKTTTYNLNYVGFLLSSNKHTTIVLFYILFSILLHIQ